MAEPHEPLHARSFFRVVRSLYLIVVFVGHSGGIMWGGKLKGILNHTPASLKKHSLLLLLYVSSFIKAGTTPPRQQIIIPDIRANGSLTCLLAVLARSVHLAN